MGLAQVEIMGSTIILQALVACSTRQAVQLVLFPIGPVGSKSESSYGIQPLYAESTSNRGATEEP